MCFSYLITNKYQSKVGSVDQNKKNKFMEFFDCLKKIVIENTKKVQIRNLREKMIEDISI